MEVITGMQLGDSYISKPSSTGQSNLQFLQASQEFVIFLYYLFSPLGIVGATPYTKSYSDKRTGKIYTSYGFKTVILPVFATIYLEWYTIINGGSIKHLPVNIFDLLTPVAIAFWISCDGSYSRRDGVITLSTDSYTLVEVQLLQTIL
ncbi:homing endonuclease [Endogone sp. FLAS-F59071]|nr:homing endonuclease [Endogone sp. FLAS-F59071]|eukprot:RUS23400.1 homing endonuclease [Endogone sp. FLAS-F59071]